jgi:hypothetical protein
MAKICMGETRNYIFYFLDNPDFYRGNNPDVKSGQGFVIFWRNLCDFKLKIWALRERQQIFYARAKFKNLVLNANRLNAKFLNRFWNRLISNQNFTMPSLDPQPLCLVCILRVYLFFFFLDNPDFYRGNNPDLYRDNSLAPTPRRAMATARWNWDTWFYLELGTLCGVNTKIWALPF